MAVKAGGRSIPAIAGAAALAGGWLALLTLGVGDVLGLDPGRWHWVPLVIGALLGLANRLRWAAAAAAVCLVALLAVQWIPGPGTWARRYIRADSLPERPADAIVVLSASVTSDGYLNGAGVERLLEGIRLHRKGIAPRLILSRVDAKAGARTVVSDQDQRALLAIAGIDPELHLLAPVGDTRKEALRAKELADRHGWTTMVVVTSATHTRRACATFEGVGLEVICRPAPDRRISWASLSSPSDRTDAFGQWLYETLGWWKYRYRGWVTAER